MLERFIGSRHITIDLHGCSVANTKQLLKLKLKKTDLHNVTQLYIITGWGKHVNPGHPRGVLKKILPKLLRPYQLEVVDMQEEKGAYKIILNNRVESDISNQLSQKFFAQMQCHDDKAILNLLQTYEKKSEQGNTEASCLVAIIYLNQGDRYYDKVKGLKFLELAREQGSLDGCIFLGELYQKGLQVPPNNKKSFDYFKEAADGGHSLGQYQVGICYLTGKGIIRDDQQGLMWVKKAAEGGLPHAQHALAESYFKGDYTEKNFALSLDYTQRAAHQNFAPAQVELARHYATGFHGIGLVEQDYQKAFHYYWLAAQAEDVFAMYQVGSYLLHGRLGKREAAQAFPWFLKCAQLGDSDGQAAVAIAYFFGDGVAQNVEESLFWCQKALEQGSDMADWLMSQAYRIGRGVKKDTTQYVAYLTKSANKGYETAKIELQKWQIDQQKLNCTPNYSLADKNKITDTTLIRLLNEKTSLTFFGLCHQDYQVDAVAEITNPMAQEKAEDLQHQFGYGQFFTIENKKHFVLPGINLPEGDPSLGRRIQSYFK